MRIIGPATNRDVKSCRPEHLFGVDHRLAYPLLAAMVEFNSRGHPFLVVVTEGLRSSDRQVYLRKTGATRTLNSKHLLGLAVDVAALGADGVIAEMETYREFSEVVQEHDLRYNGHRAIRWGGDWIDFKDGCHFEL